MRASPFSVRTWICATVRGDLLVVRQGDVQGGLGRNPGVVLGGEQEVGLDVHGAGLLDGGDGGVGGDERALGVGDGVDHVRRWWR